jgi:hypothetical protein
MQLAAVESVWKMLDDVEQFTHDQSSALLTEWEPVVQATIEAGCLAPLVPAKNQGALQLIAAGPFLKRSLNDLRGVWLMLERGYSSQAASIAASLFENALTAAVLASSEKLAEEARKTKYAEIPWSPKQLTQLDARRGLDIQIKNGKKTTTKEYEDNWTISYYHYKWLCQIKHPTWQSVYHDIKGTRTAEREYAVRPGPNNVPEDDHIKACILGGSVAKLLEACKSFFLALDSDESSAEYSAFEDRANIAHFGVLKLMKRHQGKPSPIAVLDRSFIKTDFETLRKYDNEA